MPEYPRGFIPILTRLPLDALIAPFLPRLASAVLVTGGSQARTVILTPERCTCPDHPRWGRCKHLLAALLWSGQLP